MRAQRTKSPLAKLGRMFQNRRRFVLASGLLLGASRELLAQDRIRRVALLGVGRDWRAAKELIARLRELGYVEGRNLAIEEGYLSGQSAGVDKSASDFARRRVDLIVACGVMAVIAARDATKTIPIVMLYGADPVALGFVTP